MTSMVCPTLMNGGSWAVTVTAATFLSCICDGDAGRNGHAEFLQHVDDALHRERRLRGLIAGAVEADHQSVADQLVAAHAGDDGQVLDPLGRRQPRQQTQISSAGPNS